MRQGLKVRSGKDPTEALLKYAGLASLFSARV